MGLLFSDKYNITNNHAAPSYPQTINKTVHEHRAPTDDSVKLLAEMENAAKDRIVGQCLIEDNTLNGLVVIFNMEPMLMARVAYIRFTFNGKEHIVKEELHRSFEWDKTAAVHLLFDAVRQKVDDALRPEIVKSLLKNVAQTR